MASLPRLHRILNAIEGDPETWLSFLDRMGASRHNHVRSTAGEMFYKQKDAPKEFSGIVSTAKLHVSFMDIPAFASLENPVFSLSILCEKPCTVFLNVPAEYLGTISSYVRLTLGVAMLYKQRRPKAQRLVVIADEAGQLGRFDLLMRAMTLGRGFNIQTVCVLQSIGQAREHYGKDGAQTLVSSAGVAQWFGVRDYDTADMLSRMLGTETLNFDADLEQAAARRNKAHIIRELMDGADPLEAGLNYAQQARAAVNRTKMARLLATPDEILRMPPDRQIIFAPNCPPIAGFRKPYFSDRTLAGRFLPNPYYGSTEEVMIATRWGMRSVRVITQRVPERYAHLPQYQNGFWSYVEGYRPPTS